MLDWSMYLSFAGGVLVGAGITLVFLAAAFVIFLYTLGD